MVIIIADGIAWIDSDGADSWSPWEADALAETLERGGYDVQIIDLAE